jgi:hypothetical protein
MTGAEGSCTMTGSGAVIWTGAGGWIFTFEVVFAPVWPGRRRMVMAGATWAASAEGVTPDTLGGADVRAGCNSGLVTAGSGEAVMSLSIEARLCAPMIVASVLPVTRESRTANRFVDVSFAGGIVCSPVVKLDTSINRKAGMLFNIDSNLA